MAVANNFLVHANLLTNELGYGDLQWRLLEDSQAKSKLYSTMEEAALVAKRISDFYHSLGYLKMASSLPSRQGQGYRVVILDREKFSMGFQLYQRAAYKSFGHANNPSSPEESLPADVEQVKERLEVLCLQSWSDENLKIAFRLQERLPALFPESSIEIKKTQIPGQYVLEVSSHFATMVPSLQYPDILIPVPQQIEEQIVTDADLAFAAGVFNEADERCSSNG